MCPGSCQKLGRGSRENSCRSSQLLTKKQPHFHHHTPICVRDIPPAYSPPHFLPLIHLMALYWSPLPPTGSGSWSHIWCQSHTVTCTCAVSVACVTIFCFTFLSFPRHAHATFMTVWDKQCPASWPQVQVVIKLTLKWRLFCRQQTDLINLVGLYFSSLLLHPPVQIKGCRSLRETITDGWFSLKKRDFGKTGKHYGWQKTKYTLVKKGLPSKWGEMERVTIKSGKNSRTATETEFSKEKLAGLRARTRMTEGRRGRWVAPDRDGSTKYLWEPVCSRRVVTQSGTNHSLTGICYFSIFETARCTKPRLHYPSCCQRTERWSRMWGSAGYPVTLFKVTCTSSLKMRSSVKSYSRRASCSPSIPPSSVLQFL